MFQSLEELKKNSERGVIIFWLKWVILLLSVAMLAANIYGIIISSNSNWIDICGPGLIILHVFSMVFSLGALVLTIFGILKLSFGKSFILFLIYVIVTILCLLFDYILLGQTTEKSFFDDYSELTAFCNREINNTFCLEYSTDWSLRKFSRERTTDCYDYIALIAVPWTILFALLVLLVIIQPEAFPERANQQQQDNEALNPRENDINQPLNENDPENPDTSKPIDNKNPQKPNGNQQPNNNQQNNQNNQQQQQQQTNQNQNTTNDPKNKQQQQQEIIEYEYYED